MKRRILSKFLIMFAAAGFLFNAFGQASVPTPLTPTDGAVGQSLQPTLTWSASSGGTPPITYQVQISTNPTFTAVIFTSGIGAITTTSYTYTGTLSPGTLYYWRVQSYDTFAPSGYSSGFSFRTNYTPVASGVSISGVLTVGKTLTGSYTYSDTDLDPEGTSTFKWYRSDDNLGTNKTVIAGATSSTYTLVAGDLGKYITFEVTPVASSGASPGTPVESAYSGPIVANSAPVASAVSISGTLSVGQTVTGTYTYTDADGDLEGTSTYQWYRSDDNGGTNKAAIGGATASTYQLVAGDLGKYITFAVTPVATSGTSPGIAVESSYFGPVVANVAPVASAVTVSGSLFVGVTLTGNYTYTDGEGDAQGTSTYKWYRSNDNAGTGKTAISGATSSTYTLNGLDNTKYISFEVTPVALTGTSPGTAVESGYYGPVATAPPPTVPTAVYPPDSTYHAADTLTIVWNKSTGGTPPVTYHFQLSADPTFSATIVDSAAMTDTSYKVITPLGHGAPYYWRVRAKDSLPLESAWLYDNSSAHLGYMFVVSIDGVEGVQVPIPTWPIGGNDVYSDSTDIRWYLGYKDSSLVFDVKLGLDSTFATTLIDTVGLTGDSFLAKGLISDSTYYWEIRSRDIIHPDTSAYSPRQVFHVSKSSTHPLLAWPIGGGNVFQPSQVFSWYVNGPAPGITFDFKLSRNSDLSLPDTVATGLTSRFVSYTSLRSNTTYYWQVVSHVTGYVDSSAVDSFKVVESAGPVVPILSWPIGGNEVYTNVPRLNWYVNSTGSGLSYDVRFALDTTALSSATVYTTTNNYFDVPTPLLSDTTYYWQVRSRNLTDSSAYAPPDSFRVAHGSGNPVIPTPSWPIGGGEVYTNTPTFSWYLNTASTGLTYEVRYANSIAGLSAATKYSTGSLLSYTVATPLPKDTTYYWQVRSKSVTDSSAFCAVDSFKVVSGSGNPNVPILSWPIGGATVYPNPPILNWYLNVPTNGQLKFIVQYSIYPDLSSGTTVPNIDTNNYQIPSALPTGTTYYWRVRSYNTITTDSSAWSATETFVTSDVLLGPVPSPGSPAWDGHGSPLILTTTSPTLTWYVPTMPKSSVKYDLIYSNNSDFSGSSTVSDLTKPSYKIPSIDVNKTYYWKVRTTSANGQSSYSSTAIFGPTGTTSVEDASAIPGSFELYQNYPNPFNPSTVIRYSLPRSSYVTLKIYNILGQEIRTLISEDRPAGTYNITWDGRNSAGHQVSSGAYIYRVVAGNYISTKKMILLK